MKAVPLDTGERNEGYLRTLSGIPVTTDDLLTALGICGKPDAEAGGFWEFAMIIGNLHHHDPLKANVILGRLEALLGAIPNGYETGWVLSIPTKGMTLDRECTVAAAAVVPLKRNHDRFCFDPGKFVAKALAFHGTSKESARDRRELFAIPSLF